MPADLTLTITNGKWAGRTFVLRGQGTFRIGRASDCDIVFPGNDVFKTVSGHHCALDITAQRIQARDLGSRNGTQLNGMQIGRPAVWYMSKELSAVPPRPYDVHNGDELDVGGVVLRVTMASAILCGNATCGSEAACHPVGTEREREESNQGSLPATTLSYII